MSDIGVISYSVAGAAFLLLTCLLAIGWKQRGPGSWLVAACALTTVWALTVAANLRFGVGYAVTGGPLEIIHLGGWLAFLLSLLSLHWRQAKRSRIRIIAPAVTVLAVALLIAVDFAAAFAADASVQRQLYLWGLVGRLTLSVGGIVLIENLFRNTEHNDRWKIRFFCFALAALFGFNFYMYAQALLLQALDLRLFEARGLAFTLIVPLVAVAAARNQKWSLDIFVSRRLVFHTASMVVGGAYLLIMATVAYYIREAGGLWGTVFQVTFLFGALLSLGVVLFSGRFRTWIRVFLTKHLFDYKYDYREEWLRFIATISTGPDLRQRAIQAVADIADSPGGGLWLHGGSDHFALVAEWNFHSQVTETEPVDGALAQFLARRQWVVNLAELKEKSEFYEGFVQPRWLRSIRRAWLVLPLIHHDRLIGFVLLGEPRASRDLNWEDLDLLKTVGRQVASYLAEQAAQKALMEARRFEDFSRRFAFVLHDIKNLVSQLSLLAKNADRHGDNPEFQADMIATVRESIGKMNRLLNRLHRAREPGQAEKEVELVSLLREAMDGKDRPELTMRFNCAVDRLLVNGDGDQVSRALGNLIQNAVDAADRAGTVEVRLSRERDNAVIEIEDDGPGMDAEFIRTKLFSPFHSTKNTGYGIGAFESRQVITDLGGQLVVDSRPDHGTVMHVRLPVSRRLPSDGMACQSWEVG
ncbi:MAG: XrtA/PEP-CTERM system histidine kinase PrsK [Sphingomonadales bacterium]